MLEAVIKVANFTKVVTINSTVNSIIQYKNVY